MQSLSLIARKYNLKVVAAIFAIIVLHVVSQRIIFQGENDYAKNESEPVVEVKAENETKKPEILKEPLPVVPVVQTDENTEVVPPPTPPVKIKKKKPANESAAERLRYAEKLLTGI